MTGLLLTAVSGELQGELFAFPGKTSVVIGRGRECDLRLADVTVSRRHCSLDIVPAGVWVRDLESLNGTFVNGLRLRHPGREVEPCLSCRRLIDGDELSLGENAFLVRLIPQEEEAANPVFATEPLVAAVA